MRESGPGRSDNGLRESQPLNEESQWADLPPDLLIDIIGRVVSPRDTSLSARKAVVASASVCRSWRETVVKDVVRTPEQSGLLTLTASLKQPGPRNNPIQCFIRAQQGKYYQLFLGLNPAAVQGKPSKLLLAARRVRTVRGTDYLISLGTEGDFSQANNDHVLGKLSSNFFSTNFAVYDNSQKKTPPKFLLSRLLSFENHKNVVSIDYDLVFKKPRRMQCTMHTLPASASPDQDNGISRSNASSENNPLVLTTKPPKWHKTSKCWCANYYGRVTKASIKNFQLVAADDPSASGAQEQEQEQEQEKIILQFGKIWKNCYIMDYKYPLSAFQAFAICLSSFN